MNHLPRKQPAPQASARAVLQALPRAALRAALIGRGIGESRTPRMHMAEGARLGLDYYYTLIDFDELGLPESEAGELVRLAAEEGFAGLNVTHPFKQSIVGHLDELSPEAAAIGAVNTVVFSGGKATGYNTDSWGFAESFRSAMQGADLRHVLLLGAGGAGKAVGYALCELGAGRIAIFDVDQERSAALAGRLNDVGGGCRATSVADPAETARHASGIVNTTPVGMRKYPGLPIPAAALRRDLWVADIVYFPAETELLRAAAAAGSRTLAGKGMAVFQAVKAFELITGRAPDVPAMFRHFDGFGAASDRN